MNSLWLLFVSVALASPHAFGSPRPNVIIVLTDDQGYGDLGLHGNPDLRTPHLDKLGRESVRLSRFHVSPVCSPTRASLLTGRYNYRTGVVDTYLGRAMMHAREVTLAELLRAAGYRTGIFGKWHLGDNYPMRPIDQGFEEALVHKGGGIGQPSDPPGGESYFDPVLQHNGKQIKMEGYCSDIFADAALRFIEKNRTQPFFVWLAFNAPHTPLQLPDKYYAMYKGKDFGAEASSAAGRRATNNEVTARIYGMVSNIDDNIGKLAAGLEQLQLATNTIIVFVTDNGAQQPRYNAGMRGLKGSVYDGGIRVPCFVRWTGRLQPREVDVVAAHIDLTPTLLEACEVASPKSAALDGRSLWPVLRGKTQAWPERTLFFQWHRGDTPEARRAFAARSARYKLVQARSAARLESAKFELFDMLADPGEQKDLASELPEVRDRLLAEYDEWFKDVTRHLESPRIVVGAPSENPTVLTRQDWRGPKAGWNKDSVGHWEIEVQQAGSYTVTVHCAKQDSAATIFLRIGGVSVTNTITGASHQTRKLDLPAGPCDFHCWLEGRDGVRGIDWAEMRHN